MRVRALIAALSAGYLLMLYSPLHASEPLPTWPEKVTLSGIVVRELYYGPPNYGETPAVDRLEPALILVLDAPVTVLGNPSSALSSRSFADVRRMHMRGWGDSDPRPFVGKHVTVVGTLQERSVVHDRTDVLIRLESIAATPAPVP